MVFSLQFARGGRKQVRAQQRRARARASCAFHHSRVTHSLRLQAFEAVPEAGDEEGDVILYPQVRVGAG